MKKGLAMLALTALLGSALIPATAGYYDRAPIKEWCLGGFDRSGNPIWVEKTIDCVPEWMRSCLPQSCFLPW